MIGHTFSSCDPVSLALLAKVRNEVHLPLPTLPWLQVGQQGAITPVRKDVIYVDAFKLTLSLEVTAGYCLNNDSSCNSVKIIHHQPPGVIAIYIPSRQGAPLLRATSQSAWDL